MYLGFVSVIGAVLEEVGQDTNAYHFGFYERIKDFLNCSEKWEKAYPCKTVKGSQGQVQSIDLVLEQIHHEELVDVMCRGGVAKSVLEVVDYNEERCKNCLHEGQTWCERA